MSQTRQREFFSVRWKIVLSILVTLHLVAVVAEPFRFFTRSSRGTSPLADIPRQLLAPYVEFAYLNHGYFFFAPEPGPSHVMDVRLKFAGDKSGILRFPDRAAHWPRLYYHRNFMLSEFLHQLHAPPVQASPELAPEFLEAWQADRRMFETVRDSYRRHLQARYVAETVDIDRVEHRLPSMDEVLNAHLRLDDPTQYLILPDGLERDLPSESLPGLSPEPVGAVGSAVVPPVGSVRIDEAQERVEAEEVSK